jgi:5,6,7,8-tetrahydromethanopterin hydro-lyase
MAKINKLCVGESLVGDGNEVAHIDLLIGPRGSSAETAFVNCLTNNKDGFTSLLAVLTPNLLTKPSTVMFNKVTIKGAKQAVQMFGPAQYAVAKAVDKKIQDFNYRAVKESIARAVSGQPSASEVVAKRDSVKHPFGAAA